RTTCGALGSCSQIALGPEELAKELSQRIWSKAGLTIARFATWACGRTKSKGLLRSKEVTLQAPVLVKLKRRSLPAARVRGRARLALTLAICRRSRRWADTAGSRRYRAENVLEEEVACVGRLGTKVIERLGAGGSG
ncbi:MAG: hypothetical protein VYA27_13325, partial [Verrucomicrobiota bacterium]|nr:hypothetical protein [Verrucomicrobiota bacterium]